MSSSLYAIKRPFVRDPAPLVTRCRRRTVAKGDSITFDPIGVLANLAVGEEVKDNRFTVIGDIDCEFSWVVYAVRHDPFAIKYPIVTEQKKGEGNDEIPGTYIHDDVYPIE